MLHFLVAFLICSVLCVNEQSSEAQFSAFIQKYKKQYTDEEYQKRLVIFKQNLDVIEYLNRASPRATYGITKFADLSPEEFRTTHLLPKGRIQPQKINQYIDIPSATDIPVRFDWRDKGAVTDVYDQGQCGSCWAFSATEAIESQWFLAHHPLTSLSPQQIVDCDKGRGDQGCNGGDTPTAYQYVMAAGGMDTQSTYPYTGSDDTCAFKAANVAAKISSWTYITQNKNETEMQVKLLANGPISICVDAESWQFYLGGVISSLCYTSLDHCVLLTGYDDQYVDIIGQTVKIWKIRNSWGGDWGEKGYVYVERGYDLCGVADEPTIPLI